MVLFPSVLSDFISSRVGLVRLFLFLGILLTASPATRAGNTFPYSYHTVTQFSRGEVLYSPTAPPCAFLLTPKPVWADESTVLTTWKGYERGESHSSTLSGASILKAMPSGDLLLALVSRNGASSVILVDSLAQVLAESAVPLTANRAEWNGAVGTERYMLTVNSTLFAIERFGNSRLLVQQIADNVLAATVTESGAAYISRFGSAASLHYLDTNLRERGFTLLQLHEQYRMISVGALVAVFSSGGSESCFLDILQNGRGLISSAILPARMELSSVIAQEAQIYSLFLRQSGNQYALSFEPLKAQSGNEGKVAVIPDGFIEPLSVRECGSEIIVLFRNGLVTVSPDGAVMSADYFPLGEVFTEIPSIDLSASHIVLRSATTSVLLLRDEHPFWIFNAFLKKSGEIFLWLGVTMLVFYLWRKYRRQRRVLNAALELPETGVVFVIDATGRLFRVNEAGRTLLGISNSVPLRRPFKFYGDVHIHEQLQGFIERSLAERIGQKQKITIITEQQSQEFMWSAIPLFAFLGRFNGLIITGLDITEELERKRLVNWAQLAHDMQTNLSVIRLNAEQLTSDNPQDDERRRKILHQSKLLMQKVRDIVTVGRSDQLDLSRVNTGELCAMVFHEFDESSHPNIKFEIHARPIEFDCDKTKISRALRNAVENAIRALQSSIGTVELSTRADERHVYFTIADNGIGMDDYVKSNMLKPFFTTAKDNGGSGIGTMIMQRVVELHRGELLIDSTAGKGTTITFKLPRT
ncbi:MAG: PAS domain-containing sensor histidine kinase [Candidatus Kapaibacterium sp.]